MAPLGTLHTLTKINHPRVLMIRAAANINGLELYIPPNFEFGKTNKTSEYIAKFPLGKIPAFETPSGFLLSEAAAIAHYCSAKGPKSDQLLGSTLEEQALVQQWISFASSMMVPTVTSLSMPYTGRAPYNADLEVEKHAELERWFNYVEAHLKDKKWLVKDTEGPSLADLTLGGSLCLGMQFYIDAKMRTGYLGLTAWFQRLLEIPEVNTGFGEPQLLETRASLATS